MISLVIVMALVLSVAIPATAAGTTASRMSEEDVLALVGELYPGSEYYIDQNGVIQIILAEGTNVPSPSTADAPINAPNGGSYFGFSIPWYYPPDAVPYCMTFMPKDRTEPLLLSLDEQLWEWFLDGIELGLTASAITNMIIAAGFAVTLAQVSSMMGLLGWIQAGRALVDAYAFNNTYQNYNGRMVITTMIIGGWTAKSYGGWVGNEVSASPYEDCNPTWYGNQYFIY